MAWNDDYYDSNGNRLDSSDGDQAVYDKNGRLIGQVNCGCVEDRNGNRLSHSNDDMKSSSKAPDGIHNFFGLFK
jgi:hypothetical protein